MSRSLGFRVQTIATNGNYQTIDDNLFAGYNS
jgi:hypothetical protein